MLFSIVGKGLRGLMLEALVGSKKCLYEYEICHSIPG